MGFCLFRWQFAVVSYILETDIYDIYNKYLEWIIIGIFSENVDQ